MDGKTLLRYGTEGLGGIAASDYKFFYDCMDAAVVDFVRKTRCLTSEVVITTTAGVQSYDLPPDFIELYALNKARRLVAKYNDGSNTYWPVCTSIEKIFCSDETDEREYPRRFAIIDKSEKGDRVQSTASSDGAQVAGEAILEDSSASFSNSVSPRDIIHNTTDGSEGIVLSVTDDTHLVAALFYGEDNDFTSGDSYVIIPSAIKQIHLDAPSKSDGHTLTIPYICMPAPVYSEYGFWRIPPSSCRAICYEAAFKYKMDYDYNPKRDGHLHAAFLEEVRNNRIEKARQKLQGGRYLTRT